MPRPDGVNPGQSGHTGSVIRNPDRRAAPPFVDEHSITIEAEADQVWSALLDTLEGSFSPARAATYARLVGCAHATASGPRPLAEGATIPGFRVVAAAPAEELVLDGRHRYSSYSLRFRLESDGTSATRLSAQTRASFPGLPGRAYRLAVIGTGVHAAAVRRLLSAVRRRATMSAVRVSP
jgi:hypothetical protein